MIYRIIDASFDTVKLWLSKLSLHLCDDTFGQELLREIGYKLFPLCDLFCMQDLRAKIAEMVPDERASELHMWLIS